MKKEKQTNLEMASSSLPESSGCHVYTNPNYPHSSHDVPESAKQIEIGGLPFYLPSGRVAETSLTTWKAPGSPRSTGSPLNTGKALSKTGYNVVVCKIIIFFRFYL